MLNLHTNVSVQKMNNIKYSIVYAVIRPEINEQLSVGVIVMDGKETIFRYSENKLNALKSIYSQKEYEFFEGMIKNMANDKSITTTQGIAYLNRYSNNLMAVSKLEDIDLPMTEKSSEWILLNTWIAANGLRRKIS